MLYLIYLLLYISCHNYFVDNYNRAPSIILSNVSFQVDSTFFCFSPDSCLYIVLYLYLYIIILIIFKLLLQIGPEVVSPWKDFFELLNQTKDDCNNNNNNNNNNNDNNGLQTHLTNKLDFNLTSGQN